MPSLSQTLNLMRASAPRTLGQLRHAISQIDVAQAPSAQDVAALVGFVRAHVNGGHDQALTVIAGFSAAQGQLSFRNFRRQSIAVELIQRLLTPDMVNQRNTEFCGPTAFAINLCRRQPRAWAEVIVNLASRGRAQLSGLTLKPCGSIRERAHHAIANLAEADWVLLASLRDTTSGSLASLFMTYVKGKPFEEIGVSWEALESWNKSAGYASVITLGRFYEDSFVARYYTRSGLPLPRLSLPYRTSLGMASDDSQRQREMLSFAARACEADWTVYFLVDDKLGRALQGSELADAQWREDIRASRGQLGSQASPGVTQGAYQSVRRALEGDDVGGHVFLLQHLEIGGMYVSMTAINRGKIATAELLPKDLFSQTVLGVVLATDTL